MVFKDFFSSKMNRIIHSSLLLAIAFSLLSIVHCETSYTSYRPHQFCNTSDYIRYPTNSDEVVAIVNEAIRRGVKVKAFGTRHSISDIICTDGIPVDMTKVKSFEMNDDGETAAFGSGVTIREAGDFLLEHGRALRTTPAYGGLTLGGVIGTGAHGSSVKYNSSISAQVVRMTVVNGLGQKLVISDPEDLKAFKIHLGLLGIIVDVTLYTVPSYKILGHNYVVSDDILTNGDAVKWARTSDHIMFFWFPYFKEVVVSNLTFVPVETPGNAFTNISPPSYGHFNKIMKTAKEIVFDLATSECPAASSLGNSVLHGVEILAQSALLNQTIGFAPFYTEDGKTNKNPAVGFAHVMLAMSCSEEPAGYFGLACLWAHEDIKANMTALDNEFSIALTDFRDFAYVVQDIASKTPLAFPMEGLALRISGESDTYMSTAYQRDTVHVEYLVVKRENSYEDAIGCLAGYQTTAQAAAKNFTGRSHWGKSGSVFHSSEMLDLKLVPSARDNFIAAMKKFDPNGIFENSFGRRLKRTGTKIDLDPSITRCALLDNCFCSKNSDCGRTQTCTFVPGYTHPVCKTKNEIPEKRLSKSSFPSPLEVLDWLAVTVPTLAAAVVANCSTNSVLTAVPNEISSVL